MLLAGDVGGTKTLLGLFAPAPERPQPVEVGEFITLEYSGLEQMVREFLRARNMEPRAITAACFGVAGAITDQVARLTNVPWLVDGEQVAQTTGLRHSVIINDLDLASPKPTRRILARIIRADSRKSLTVVAFG